MPLGDGDLPAMLAELGVDVVYNDAGEEICGKGIVDHSDQDLLEAEGSRFAGRVTVVIVQTGAFPKLREGSAFTLAGAAHRATKLRLLDDGALTKIFCHPV